MHAVVDSVISLYVPAIVVLVDAVAMDPHDRGMFLGAIKVFGNKQPCRYGLAVRSRVVNKLRLNKYRAIDACGHGVAEAYRLRAGNGINDEEVGGVARVSMLVDEALVIV